MVAKRRQRRRRGLRRPRDPVVHRLRSRPHRLFRQRRHPRLRAFARDHAGRQQRRGAAAVAQQRGARDQAHQQCRLRAVRSRADARRGRRGAGHAGRDRRQGRLRVPEPALAGLRPERPRRLRPQRAVRPRRLRVSPSAASTAPARTCTSPRCCATRRAWPRSAFRSRWWSSVRTASSTAARPSPTRASAAAALEVPLVPSAPTGTWRVRAFTDPKRPAVGEATFMVEDYVPDRLEFDLSSHGARRISRAEPAQVTLDGRYLYGAPAAGLEVAGEVIVAPAAERAGFCRLPLRPLRRAGRDRRAARSTACRRPTPTAGRTFPLSLDKVPQATRPLEARVTVRLAEAGRPRGRAQAHAAGDGGRADDRRAAAVLRPLARRRRAGDLRRRRRRRPTARR